MTSFHFKDIEQEKWTVNVYHDSFAFVPETRKNRVQYFRNDLSCYWRTAYERDVTFIITSEHFDYLNYVKLLDRPYMRLTLDLDQARALEQFFKESQQILDHESFKRRRRELLIQKMSRPDRPKGRVYIHGLDAHSRMRHEIFVDGIYLDDAKAFPRLDDRTIYMDLAFGYYRFYYYYKTFDDYNLKDREDYESGAIDIELHEHHPEIHLKTVRDLLPTQRRLKRMK